MTQPFTPEILAQVARDAEAMIDWPETAEEITRAIYALARYFRDDCYSEIYGWVPRFDVAPTHYAVYRTRDWDGSYYDTPQHQLDLNLAQYERLVSRPYPGDLLFIGYDQTTGAAEWVPGVGPAPIWSHYDAAHSMTREEMGATLDAWIKERW